MEAEVTLWPHEDDTPNTSFRIFVRPLPFTTPLIHSRAVCRPEEYHVWVQEAVLI